MGIRFVPPHGLPILLPRHDSHRATRASCGWWMLPAMIVGCIECVALIGWIVRMIVANRSRALGHETIAHQEYVFSREGVRVRAEQSARTGAVIAEIRALSGRTARPRETTHRVRRFRWLNLCRK